MTSESNRSTTDPAASTTDHQFTVEDATVLGMTKTELEEALSDPDRVAAAIPGVAGMERTDDGTYVCSITQSISGITHLTLSMESEFEIRRPEGPATAVIRGTAEDAGTGGELTVIAAIRLEEAGQDAVELSYVGDISIRSENAILSPDVLEPTLTDTIHRAVDNIDSVVPDRTKGDD